MTDEGRRNLVAICRDVVDEWGEGGEFGIELGEPHVRAWRDAGSPERYEIESGVWLEACRIGCGGHLAAAIVASDVIKALCAS